MKNGLKILAAFLLLIAATLTGEAFDQMSPGDGRRPAFKDDSEITREEYSDMKKRALSMIEERRKRLDEEKACVESAASASELRKCRPQPPRRPGGSFQGGNDGGPQRSRPGDAPQP